jgi:hypothetical protein
MDDSQTAGAAEDEAGIRRQLEGIVLGRAGHFSYVDGGTGEIICHAATIAKVTTEAGRTWVNLGVLWPSGEPYNRVGVKVGPRVGPESVFHFTRDCPDGR